MTGESVPSGLARFLPSPHTNQPSRCSTSCAAPPSVPPNPLSSLSSPNSHHPTKNLFPSQPKPHQHTKPTTNPTAAAPTHPTARKVLPHNKHTPPTHITQQSTGCWCGCEGTATPAYSVNVATRTDGASRH